VNVDSDPAVVDSEALARRWQELAIVSGRLAHDFRNSLTSMLGYVELALPGIADASPASHFLNKTLLGGHQAVAWIERLEQLARRRPVSWSPTEPARAIGQIVPVLDLPDNVRLDCNLPQTLPRVVIDVESLQLVLRQLLDNAIEACTDGGHVRIISSVGDLMAGDCSRLYGSVRPGRHVVVIIADDGPGITPAVQRHLLAEPFFTTKARHHGLGLPLAFLILYNYQAGFCLAPAGPKGTEARVYLPVEPGAGAG